VADVDTSANRDPSPTAAELLAIRDRMNVRLEAGLPARIIRSVAMRTDDLAFALQKRESYHAEHPIGRRTQIRRAFAALETAQHLGLEYAGRVVEAVG
jgi:hypothetical protein